MVTPAFTDISSLPEATQILINGLRIGVYSEKPSASIMSLIHDDTPADLRTMLETMAHVSNASVNIGDWYIETRCVFSAAEMLATIDFDEDRETAVVIGADLGPTVLVAAYSPEDTQCSVYSVDEDYQKASWIGSINELAKPLKKKQRKK